MERESPVLLARLILVGLLLGGALSYAAGALGPDDQTAPLDQAIATAEASLARHDFPAAEGHYRLVLFQGWLLRGTLDALDDRLPEARAALEKSRVYLPEDAFAHRSLATVFLQMGDSASAAALLTPLAAKDPRDVETTLADREFEAARRLKDKRTKGTP